MTIDPFSAIQSATRTHRRSHGCGAYTFEDGPALTSMAAASGARRILELGTALGYTACCLAAGHPEARVDTIEGDPDHARLALEQIGSVGLSDRITVHHGACRDLIMHIGKWSLEENEDGSLKWTCPTSVSAVKHEEQEMRKILAHISLMTDTQQGCSVVRREITELHY